MLLELYFKDLGDLSRLAATVIRPLVTTTTPAAITTATPDAAAATTPDAAASAWNGVVLTYKGKESHAANPAAARRLAELDLGADLAVHAVWSAKNAYVGTGKRARGDYPNRTDATFARLAEHAGELKSAGVGSVLVVSGTGAKKELDAVESLKRMDARLSQTHGLPVGCAYNPHIGGVLDDKSEDRAVARDEERRRLRDKLASGRVSSVWLNFGADVEAADEGLGYLKQLQEELSCSVELFGSVFIPSKAWLAKMKFRCWSGCFLGDKEEGEYLGSVEGAADVTLRLLEVYKRHGVEPLVESSIRTEKERDQCVAFLQRAGLVELTRPGEA